MLERAISFCFEITKLSETQVGSGINSGDGRYNAVFFNLLIRQLPPLNVGILPIHELIFLRFKPQDNL